MADPGPGQAPGPGAREPPPYGAETSEAAYRAGQAAARNRWLLYLIGAASAVAGLAAIAMPFFASLAASTIAGACLTFAGIVGLVAILRRRHHWHMAGALALSLLAIVTGEVMLLRPFAGILALSTLIIAWLGASGALRVYHGIRRWQEPGAGVMELSGGAAILVACLLWFGLPYSAAWLPGLVLGLDLLAWGALLIWLAARASVPDGP